MSGFKSVNRLKEYILSNNIDSRITAELLNNTSRNDFFAVFLSVCNKKERARVFHGSGDTLPLAWSNAEKSLEAFRLKPINEKNPFTAVWVKADIVTNYEEIPAVDINKLLVKSEWINFMRAGISLDPEFKYAFLEAELNGNKIINYYTEKEIAMRAIDYKSNRISLDNLNQYLKKYYATKPLESIPERITVFYARGFFCGEDGAVHELYSDNMDYGRRRIDVVTGDVIRSVITGASEYLVSQIDRNGKFVYGYFPVFDNELKNYNILRHASSLWSLINLYRMSGDASLIPKLNSALGYMLTYIEHKDDDVSYLIERRTGEVKLGGNSVAVIMLTEYMDVFESSKYINIVRKLANGILELLNQESGTYWHILEFPGFARKEEYRTVYYDGEATFALARAYTYTKDQRCLDGAKAAVENFITRNYIKHRDHWVAYALYEVTRYITDVRYYEFALRNADENLQAIYNRATSFHTYLEMLMVSWRTYQRAIHNNIDSDYIKSYDPTRLAQTIYYRARHMLNGYFYPEYAMYMKSPGKIAGSFMVRHHNYRVRIDDNQHFIGGYYLYSVDYDELTQRLSEEFIRGLDRSEAAGGVTTQTGTFEPDGGVEAGETPRDEITKTGAGLGAEKEKEKFPACLAFSADKNAVVYSSGGTSSRINGGLSLPLLMYYLLTLINKGRLSWTDMATVNENAEKENSSVNSLGLACGEQVNLFTLFCSATATNAPDAVVAIGGHIYDTIGEKKNSTVGKLRQIGSEWGVPNECLKNLTGRFYEQNPQYFTAESLIKAAKEILAFDMQNNLIKNSVVYNGKYLTCNSILGSVKSIIRYLCFGEERNYHAIVMAENNSETLYIVACGAKSFLERDAAILNALFHIKEKSRPGSSENTDIWVNIPQSILTICGDTYCGERYTKWRIKRNIDDPIQRYGDRGYAFSFENVKRFITKDSFNIINSECVLSPVYDKTQQTGKYLDFVLGADPEKTINCYKEVNINAVMLANNHMMDFGPAGCRQTKKYFDEAGILTVGAGVNIKEAEKPVCLIINGHRVIFFNAYGYFLEKRHKLFQHYCLGENTGAAFVTDILEKCSMFERIAEYREKYPEAFIILSPHWGIDFNENHLSIRPIAQRAVGAGVDLILGHGPHIPVGVEHVSGIITVYSLGNFVFNTTGIDLEASGKPPYGVVSQLYFREKSITLRLYPIYIHNLNTFFQPKPVDIKQFDEFCGRFFGVKKFNINEDELGYNLEFKLARHDNA